MVHILKSSNEGAPELDFEDAVINGKADAYEMEPDDVMAATYDATFNRVQTGRVIQGEIIGIAHDHVAVDIGYKTEGEIPLEEFIDEEGQVQVDVGDWVEVLLIRFEQEKPVISKRAALRQKQWQALEEIHRADGTVEGTITELIKGGFMVDVGLPAFLPYSQAADRPVQDPSQLIGNNYTFKILDMDNRRRSVVISRRAHLSQVKEQTMAQRIEELAAGDVVKGVVTNVVDYGLFVDLGGITGLVHISDIAWSKIWPYQVTNQYQVGQEIDIRVLSVDKENKRVALGVKQLRPDPWEDIRERYPVGAKVRGEVVHLTAYAAFVEVEKDVTGMIHKTDLSWSAAPSHPNQRFAMGDQIEALVLKVSEKNRKMSLGTKLLEANPWDYIEENYAVGMVVENKIKKITKSGIFIQIYEGINGLVPESEITQTKSISHSSELFRKGQPLQVIIRKIDRENGRILLGLYEAEGQG